jgi:two-component system, cell cycle sensor histidine kinase and response regulator CckA
MGNGNYSDNLKILSPESLQPSEMQLIKGAIDSITEGVLICDARLPDFPTVYVNAAFEKLTGYTFEEIKGRNCRFLQGAETSPRMVKKIRESLKRKKTFHGKILNYRKNGVPFWNDLRITPLFDESGSLTYFVGVQNDITERKISEESLRASEARFRLLCESAPLGVFMANNQGQCLFSNLYLQKLAGLPFDQLLGFGWEKIIHPEDRQRFSKGWVVATETGTELHQQYRFLPADGIIRWVNIRTAPVYSAGGQLVSHVGTVEDITERKHAEELLSRAEAKYRNLVESSPAIVYFAHPHPPFSTIYVSQSVIKFGYSTEEWFDRPDMWISLIHEEDRERVLRTTEVAMLQGLDTDLEYRIIARDGAIRWVHDKGRFVSDEQGNRLGWQGVMLDITETKELEEQLRQSQKLESVGLLAGGIAHDFNNMLNVITGYSELALRRLDEHNPLRQYMEEIKKAGKRSAALTNQLLAFSRQQVLQPVVLDLNEVVGDTIKMLQRLIGEDMQLTTTLSPKAGRVTIDPGQMSQILMNLAVNARDAMPQGGKLTIETANIFFEPEAAGQTIGILPGAYVMLSVSDTGTGMSEETKQHLFEPFYTTKEIGKGTGLGLATVYGIVKQSGGNISVDSKEGSGTTFKVYLPRVVEQQIEVEKLKEITAELPKGTETILLVEDEEMVRQLSMEILKECGYTVISAVNGVEALKLCEEGECRFDLLMTDVVMPQMGGRELAEKLAEKLPGLRILFTSGYTDDAVMRHGVVETNANFIQKPFTPLALAGKIREILDDSH